jgi:hypothetical protein
MRHGVVEPLGDRRPLERQRPPAGGLEKVLDPARGFELPHAAGEIVLDRFTEDRTGRAGPGYRLLDDRVVQESGKTFSARHLGEERRVALVDRAR